MSERNYREKAKRGESQRAGGRRQARRLLAIAIVGVMVMGSLIVKVEAVPGGLDTTFSGDGRQITTFGNNYDIGQAVAIQEDGKIVVAGVTVNDGGNSDFALARYNPNGTLDTTFSGDGKQTTNFFGLEDYGTAVAIQSNGKIVVAGRVSVDGANVDFGVARYNSNGTLDTTFSADGKQTTGFFAGSGDYAAAIAIQTDGKIVAAGSTFSSGTAGNFAVARYNPNGTLDTTFSGDGRQTTDFFGLEDYGTAVAIQSNGKIVVAGIVSVDGENTDFGVARYNSNGTLDTTFSDDGKQTTGFFGKEDEANAIAIQSDGRIVVAGEVTLGNGTNNFGLARYNTDGSFDNGSVNDSTPGDEFGNNGRVNTDFFGRNDSANAVAIQSDGKIVAAGNAGNANAPTADFALARYNRAGTLDTTFSADGKQTTGFFAGSHDFATAIAIQTDGKIVVAGFAKNGFALARYHDD